MEEESETCPVCEKELDMPLHKIMMSATRHKRSLIVKCGDCLNVLSQIGYCAQCHTVTGYLSDGTVIEPQKTPCGSCGILTFGGIQPTIVEI